MKASFDPFDEAEPRERGEYSRPKDGETTYVWKGSEYPRVTDILSIAPGKHLMAWYAEVSALRAAAPLVHAGLYVPDEKMGAKLEKFVDSEPFREISPEQAINEACNAFSNMREPERYRDLRAWIGSLAHHFFYSHALGVRVADGDRIDWLMGTARTLKLIPEYTMKRFEAYGKTLEDVERDLAFCAVPHIDSGMKFIETFKPEWEAIGLEAIAVNTGQGYAGTADWFATFKRESFRSADVHWNYPGSTARLCGDWKTGTESKSHRVQVAAYCRADFIGIMADQSENEIPETDGIGIVYTRDGEPPVFRQFAGEQVIDRLYEGFCGLVAYYRLVNDLPAASRARKWSEPKPKKGERECPF